MTPNIKKIAVQFGANEVDSMLERQNMNDMPTALRNTREGAIGCLGIAALPEQGNLLMFAGTPINGPEEREFTGHEAAQRLFPKFDGAFIGVFWDVQRQILVVATDCLGMQPLYIREDSQTLTLVSETKALTGEPDLAAWGAFISIGHPIGDRSLMRGVKRVPAASLLVYDCRQKKLTVNRYWHWPQPSDAWRRYDFLGALEAEMKAYAMRESASTLLLSGGFDSRLLLFLLKHARIPFDALVVAHEDEHDDADGRLAAQIARLTDTNYRKLAPPTDFFSSAAYLNYLAASDVGFPSLDLFIAQVASQIDSQAVWDGLAPGFLFMPLHQPEGGFKAYQREEIRGPDSAIWRAAQELFTPKTVRAMREGFIHDLYAAIAALPQDSYGLARFVIENRSRNRAAINPLKVYANHTIAFTPGLSKEFIAHAATIPHEEKQKGHFYRELFSRLDTRALSVPFLSGGELIKPKRFSAAYYQEYARLQLNRHRMRHPSVFAFLSRSNSKRRPRSIFLDKRLFGSDAPWLNADIANRLVNAQSKNYLAWKLLFHWKAWRTVHDEGLEHMLKGRAL